MKLTRNRPDTVRPQPVAAASGLLRAHGEGRKEAV